MNGWRTASLLLGCALLFSMVSGAQMKREREAVTAYYVNAAKTETRMAETRLALKERERQAVAHRLDSAVTAYAKQRTRIRIVSDTVQTVRTDSVIREYIVPAEYIEAADSVATTCTLYRATCDASVAGADSVIASQKYVISGMEAQLKAERKGKWMERISTALIWGAAGYAAGMLFGK
jgi:hypothetical protein